MPRRVKLTVGLIAVVALCAGFWAHAQNQPAPPKVKAPPPKVVPKKVEDVKTDKPAATKGAKTVAPATAKDSKSEKPAAQSEKTEKAASAKDRHTDSTETEKAEVSPEELEIRASAEAFTELYNKHDAAGLAALFAEKAEMVDEEGNLVKGREEIEADFKQQFETEPECIMHVEVDTVRVLTPHLALEEGVARCAPKPDEPEEITNYVCVHVKMGDKWVLASVTDFPAVTEDLTPHEHLQELSWLLGDWIDESPDSNVHSVCDWDDSGNFILYDFQAQIAGQYLMGGTTRIGWDAVAKQFRSWVFDSEGGFSEGVWFFADDEWIVKMSGSTADGEMCSSTNVYRPVNDDTILFRSYDRIVDGELMPDIDELVIKRSPEAPMELSEVQDDVREDVRDQEKEPAEEK